MQTKALRELQSVIDRQGHYIHLLEEDMKTLGKKIYHPEEMKNIRSSQAALKRTMAEMLRLYRVEMMYSDYDRL